MEKADTIGTLNGFKEFHGEKVNDLIEEYLLSLNRIDIHEKKEDESQGKSEREIDIGSKCIARCWYNNGYSRRCTRNHKEGVFCKKHSQEYKSGNLNYGLMNSKRPIKYIGVGPDSLKKKKGKNIPWKGKEDESELIYYPGISSLDNIKEEESEVKEEESEVKEEKSEVKEEESEVKEEESVKVKKKGRKCGICGETGHNKKTCKKNKQVTQKDVPKEVPKEVPEEVLEEVLEEVPEIGKICQDCKENICDCETIPLDIIERKECEGLLSDEENHQIYYQGIYYYYDKGENIVSNNEYEEVGSWDLDNESIKWYSEEYKQLHEEHPDFSK